MDQEASLSGIYCSFWITSAWEACKCTIAYWEVLRIPFLWRKEAFAYLNGADSYTKFQLIVFAFQWYEQFEKFILKEKKV